MANVDTMLRSMPARMLLEWMAYYDLEPFGEWRADLREAQHSMLFANAHRDPKRGRPYTLSDFMFDFDKEPEAAETKLGRQIAAGKMIAAAFGGIWRSGNQEQ